MTSPAPSPPDVQLQPPEVSEVSSRDTELVPAPPQLTTRHLVTGRLSNLRVAQRDALAAFEKKNRRGIVVLPCGVGKTAVVMHALCRSDAFKALVITANTQTAIQFKQDILNSTNFSPNSLFLITGHDKQSGFRRQPEAVVITTYTLFAESKDKRKAQVTQSLLQELIDTRWDFVALDEVHVAPAPAFKAFVRLIIDARAQQPPAILALTATLFREHRNGSGTGAAADDASNSDLTMSDFGFIGRCVYRARWAEMQRQGIIAKLKFVRVTCPIDDETQTAVSSLEDSLKNNREIKNDLFSLTPSKIEAMAAIARYHNRCLGQQVLIFVEARVIVNILKNLELAKILEEGYIILDGNASDESRKEAMSKIEDGSCPGLILTSICETGLNLTSPKLSAVIKVNGPPKSRCRDAQRTGRVTRTPDEGAFPDESPEAAVVRRRAQQKQAFVYDLVTTGSSEEDGANYREASLLLEEGYSLTAEHGEEFQILHHSSDYVRDTCNAFLQTDENRVKLTPGERLAVVDAMLRRKEENAIERQEKRVKSEIVSAGRTEKKKAEQRVAQLSHPMFKERGRKRLEGVKRKIDDDTGSLLATAVKAVRSTMSTMPSAPQLARSS